MIKNARPVSEKAYKCFTERIRLVAREPERMITALDLYLSGHTDTYADALDEYERMTFEMLRFEIDRAIDRSARARERARMRKESAAMTKQPTHRREDIVPEDTEGMTVPGLSDEEETLIRTIMSSRRLRRASERQKRAKTKWRKIG